MSVKIRGYQWQMTYRGFEVYYSESKGTTFCVLDEKAAERMGVELTQYQFEDNEFPINVIDEFWTVIGR